MKAVLFAWASLIIAGVIGWSANIVALTGTPLTETGMFVVRAAGIFVAPIGVILGWAHLLF